MTFKEFTDKYNGKGIDYDGVYFFQCMDLAHQYAVDVNGQDFPPTPGAKDVWNLNCPGYTKIPNTPENVPQRGDIIIWGRDIGPYGHIAIFDNGDVNSFESWDQNFPVNSLVHLQKHSYKGVLGWLRHDSAETAQDLSHQPQITPQTRLPLLDNKEQQQVLAEFEAKNRKIADDAVTIQRAIKDAEEAIKDAKELKSRYDSLDAEFKAHLQTHNPEEVEIVTTTYPASPETPPKSEATFELPPILVSLIQYLKKWLNP